MKVQKGSLVVYLIAILSLCACQKPADEGGPSEGSAGATPASADRGESGTDCGVVTGGDLRNPVNLEDGSSVRITQVIGNNLLAIEGTSAEAGGPLLLKLHGLASGPESRAGAAMNMLKELSRGGATFFQAAPDCNITLGDGGQGVIGQLISANGESFSEKLVRAGLVDVDPQDACGGEKIAPCLTALKDTGIESKGEMRDFLWKPNSDKNGNLVIHELHCNTSAFVNGQPLEYTGSGNGRCGTFRASKPGCAFGGNIKVEIIDKSTGQPYSHNGEPFVMIQNGCSRVEFK